MADFDRAAAEAKHNQLTVPRLKVLLEYFQLDTNGPKAVLVARLVDHEEQRVLNAVAAEQARTAAAPAPAPAAASASPADRGWNAALRAAQAFEKKWRNGVPGVLSLIHSKAELEAATDAERKITEYYKASTERIKAMKENLLTMYEVEDELAQARAKSTKRSRDASEEDATDEGPNKKAKILGAAGVVGAGLIALVANHVA